MHRVAITGRGIVSCLGCDLETVAGALYAGKSGIIADKDRVVLGFRSPLTGSIKDFTKTGLLSRKQRKTMPEFGVWTYASVMDALEESGLSTQDIQNPETGLIFGCDSSSEAAVEQVDLLRERGETRSIGSGLIFRSMNSTLTMNLNILLGTQGACWTLSSACSSAGHALGQSFDLIAQGRQERMICGGAQEISWQSICSFDGLGAFSLRLDEPEKASRPFDKGRDGLVPGGGAAALVLERWDLAEQRGANIIGEISGYGFSSDGAHISIPSPEGLSQAMGKALDQARLSPGDIDYICAHATSTPNGDSAEAENLHKVFGPSTPPVSSLKSMTGHELWMSGGSQVIYSTLMAEHGFTAPYINFEDPDPTTEHLNIIRETLSRPPSTVLCNAAGFGGTNSCLILRFAQ